MHSECGRRLSTDVGKERIAKAMKAVILAGGLGTRLAEETNLKPKPMVEIGGKPIEEYAPDFWLVSPGEGGDPCGFITSPWFHPEKGVNIAMGYVPFDGTLNANGFPKWEIGKKFKVHLPDIYSDSPGEPVDAVTVEIPFTESHNANTREVVKG